MANNYENLEIWKKSMRFSLLIYKLSGDFPKEEKYGIISQIQRAAVSVPANIAEGCGRASNREFNRFINIAQGSLNEVITFLYICKELNYLNEKEFLNSFQNAQEVGRMLTGFKKSLT